MARQSYRILMIAPTSFFLDYGCHIRILEEARALQKLGQQVTIVTYFMGRDLPGLEIVRTRPTPWRADYEVGSSPHKIAFDLLLGWRVLTVGLARRFDLVHGHLHEGALIGYAISRLRRVPLVFDFQGSLTGEMLDHHFIQPDGPALYWWRRLEERINSMADVVVTSTQRNALLLGRGPGYAPRVVRALPDSVNLDFFDRARFCCEEVAGRKAALNVPPDRPLVVYLGLLADYHGIPQLLQAMQILQRRQVDAHLLLMGFPNVERYRQLARELGVEGCVTFTGKVPYEEAPAYLALGDVAVEPKLSATEGSGKILNYMAMELPIVAYENPISREYLGSLGVYANPAGDPGALARALEELLLKPELRAAIAPQLRQRAARRFSWDRMGRQLLSIYRSLLQS